jgi:tRNA modification GTPase
VLSAGATDSGGESIALNTRHRNAFGNALAAIERASGLAEGLTETLEAAEIIAVELHEANEHLGQIAGQVVTDDLLGRIFANFCIGK